MSFQFLSRTHYRQKSSYFSGLCGYNASLRVLELLEHIYFLLSGTMHWRGGGKNKQTNEQPIIKKKLVSVIFLLRLLPTMINTHTHTHRVEACLPRQVWLSCCGVGRWTH